MKSVFASVGFCMLLLTILNISFGDNSSEKFVKENFSRKKGEALRIPCRDLKDLRPRLKSCHKHNQRRQHCSLCAKLELLVKSASHQQPAANHL